VGATTVTAIGDVDVSDVGFVIGDDAGNLEQHPWAIWASDNQA
jgi:hypothetical protein